MAKLILKGFTCLEETDEAGWDSPYFVVFVGERGNIPTSVTRTFRDSSWDNDIGTGDKRSPNLTLDSSVNPDTIVLVALMEEDVNHDITGSTLEKVATWMQTLFGVWGRPVFATQTVVDNMAAEFRKALNAYGTNDELIAIKRVTIPATPGDVPVLTFSGDGGKYNVRFATAA